MAIIVAGGIGGYLVLKTDSVPEPFINSSDYGLDADGFLWGTEAYLTMLESPNGQKEIDTINNTLKVKNLKFRVDWASEKNHSNIVCLGPNCLSKYDFDKFAQIFKTNNWSMRPMFSLKFQSEPYTESDIDDYVNYIDWFINRYKNDTHIKYIELINTPLTLLAGNPNNPSSGNLITLKQLLGAQNKVYNQIKGKFPDIMVGSHGFEYMMDDKKALPGSIIPAADIAKEMVEYFLNKSNGAKFDYWAFHGYETYPSPIKTPTYNKYSGISGILEIRKKLDANGWQDRLIVDTENVPSSGPTLPDDLDKSDANLMLQELIIKRTLKYNNKLVLSGITPLKIITRGDTGEHLWGSLKSDGSLSRTIKATALLLSKLNEYNYASHISGEFDKPDIVWIEKFQSGDNKELYIFFEPFTTVAKTNPNSDSRTLTYNLNLNKKPVSITLTDVNGEVINLTPTQSVQLETSVSPKFLEVEY